MFSQWSLSLRIFGWIWLCLECVSGTDNATVSHEEKMLKMALESEDQRNTAITQRYVVIGIASVTLALAIYNTIRKKGNKVAHIESANALERELEPDEQNKNKSKYDPLSTKDVQLTFEI